MKRNYIIKSILFFSILLFAASCKTVEKGAPYRVYEGEGDEKIIVGKISWAKWQQNAGWDNYSAPAYIPSELTLEKIDKYSSSMDIKYYIFGASWCGDSKEEMPRLFKLLNMAGVAPGKIELLGVDRKKFEPTGQALRFDIRRVPTLVITKNGAEIGQIVEHPDKSWGTDILMILFK
jgi:thiol-disulfide isomerase/thioredoxin